MTFLCIYAVLLLLTAALCGCIKRPRLAWYDCLVFGTMAPVVLPLILYILFEENRKK